MNEGYAKAYAEAREEKRKTLEAMEKSKRRKDKRRKPKKGKDDEKKDKQEENFDAIIDAMLDDVKNGDLMISRETKALIWKDAMAASWGPIDMVEFEENWTTYIKKHLK